MTLRKRFWVQQTIVVTALVLVIIALIATSCENHKLAGDPGLRGKWVESVGRTDTLHFSYFDDMPVVTLYRGKEWVDGQFVYKSSGGSYHYTLKDDQISLKWFASSSLAWHQYSFHATDNFLLIGNFYDINRRGATERFERLD